MNRATYSEFEFASQLRDRDSTQGAEGEGLRDFLALLSMYRVMIVGVALLGLLGGLAYGVTRVPQYTAVAEVMLSPGQDPVAQRQGGNFAAQAAQPNDAVVESEIEVLRSPGLIARLIDKVGVDVAGRWVEQPRAALVANVLGRPPPHTYTPADINAVVRDIRNSLTIARKETSYVLDVGATTANPENSVALANALTLVYLESKVEQRADTSRSTNRWLNDQIDALKADVAQKEAAVEAYRAEMNLLSVGGTSVSETQLSSIQNTLIQARGAYTESKARLDQLNRLRSSGGSVDSIASVLNSSTVLEMRRREAEVAGRQAEAEQRYGENHPDVARLRRERQESHDQLEAEINRIVSSLENEVEVARLKVADIEAAQRQTEGRVVSSNRSQVRLRDLERQAQAASDLYQRYLLLARESGEDTSRKVMDARIVSDAPPPERPSTPSLWLWVAFFGAVGLVAGVAAALLRGALNNRLVRPEDVPRKLGKTALVSIPLVTSNELRQAAPDERSPASVVVGKPMSKLAESVRVLLTQIMSMSIDGQGVVIAVTSALAHEGKTTTAASLGRVAAMGGLKVLMIEGDLRVRSLSKLAPVPERPDHPDFVVALRKGVDWRTAIVHDPTTDAHFLPATAPGMVLGNPFATARMRKILDEVRAEYELIVLDCPPVLAVADARSLSAIADGTVVVSSWNSTPAPAVRTAIRELEASGGKIVGVVLNRLKPSLVKRISYGDSLYFGEAGSKYYTS
jgi:uncharacterized protein involved in exopolysaccharide biosynthesis/Mrp family chromosome partitioning ATPase